MATFTAPSLKKYQDIFNAEKARVDDPSIGRVFGPGMSGYEGMLKNIAYYSPGGAGYQDELRDFELVQARTKASELGITPAQLVENPNLATDPNALAQYKAISNPVIPKTLGALATPDTQVDAIAKQFADIQARMQKEGVTDASGNFLIKPVSSTPSSADLQTGTSGSTPQLPQNNTQSTQETTFASMQAQIDTLKKANEDANAQRVADTQKQIDAYDRQITSAQAGENVAVQEAKQKALDALNEGNAVFRKAQAEYTALSDQMQGLLTDGQALIQQQKAQTGLASIMTPRINQTISDVTAQAGVIQAVLTAKYNGMAAAYGVLDATVKAVNVYKQDEINYYTSIQDAAKNELITLTKNQREYLDYKITSLAAELKTAEANSEALKNAFLDPDTALKFAKAGITINTPQEQWGAKLATQDYSEELAKTSSDMAAKGYSLTPIAGYIPLTLTDSRGNTKTFYGKPSGDSGNVTIPTKDKVGLLGAGLTEDRVAYLEKGIATYGLDEVLQKEELTPAQEEALRKAYGAESKTVSKVAIRTAALSAKSADVDGYLRGVYTKDELREFAKNAGYTRGGFLGIGVGDEGIADYLSSPEARTKYAELLTEQYKAGGYTITE